MNPDAVTAAAELLTGCSAATLTGRPATDAFHHAPELLDLLLETLRTRVGVPHVSVVLPRSDRAPLPLEVTISGVRATTA